MLGSGLRQSKRLAEYSKFFALPYISAGFVAVLVGYAGAGPLIFQAANAAGATTSQIGSWLWALGLGMGISSFILTVYYRQPILIAWSTPGAALLAISLPGLPLSDAVGVFLFCSLLLALVGASGLFQRLVDVVPESMGAALLAGILLEFGLDIFVALESDVELVGLLLLTYLTATRFVPRFAIPLSLLAGIAFVYFQGSFLGGAPNFSLTHPEFVMPTANLSAMIGIGIPLFVVTMASQNVPGVAALRAHGYRVNASPLVGWSGLTGLVLAPFGGFTFNLAAITAAICMTKDVHPDASKRYPAVIWASVFYVITGLFGATFASLFMAVPSPLIMGIAGLALIPTIANSLNAAMRDVEEREIAFVTFAVTASGISLFSVTAPLWGLVIGMGMHLVRKRKGS